MPIDPTIALGFRGAPDITQSLAQIYALKGAGQQQQAQQQAMQLNQLRLKQAGREDADNEAVNSALSGNSQVDPATGMPTLNRAGALNSLYSSGHGKAALGLGQSLATQDIANSKAAADFQKTKLENQKAMFGLAGQIASTVHDQQSWDAAVPQLQQIGALPPGHAPASYDPQLVQQFQNSAMTAVEHLTAKQKEQDAAETARHNASTESTAAATQAETAKYHGVESKQRQQEIGIQGARLNLEKQKQGTDQQASIETQAQQIANGDVKSLSLSRNNPYSRAVMQRVYEINPKYTDSLYTATQDLRSSKPNSMGGNVGRLGTAILHADEALKGSGDLGFSEGLLTGVGTTGTASYRQSAEFLTGEIGQYVEGGKLTNGQGNDLKKDLFSSRQSVRDSAIHKIIDLSGGKLKSQMEQFKNATQTEFPTDRVFNDSTISGALRKHGIIGGSAPAQGTSGFDWNAHPVAK